MLSQKGEIQPLDDEQILLKTPGYVSLEVSVPKALRTANPNFNVKCDSGVAYVTNRRVSPRLCLWLSSDAAWLTSGIQDHLSGRAAYRDFSVLLGLYPGHI